MSRTERRAEERKQQKALRKKGALQSTRTWLTAGTLAAYAAVGPSRAAFAATSERSAQPSSGVSAASALPSAPEAPVANLPLKRFEIPAGPLDAALRAFEQTSGLKIRIQLPAGTVDGFVTKGVSGLYRSEQALKVILNGTGLNYGLTDAQTMAVSLQHVESVDVTANSNSVNLTQFTEPLTDVAQTVNVVPSYILQEQAVTTLRDSLRNAPGISIAAGEAGAQGDNLTIRGFSARNDIFLDGIRDFGSYYRDSFDYDAVEVLQGPASVEFGRGSTGGVVNQESKSPQLREFVSGSVQLGTNLMRRVTADVNKPLENLGEGAAFRLNVAGMESSVAERNVAQTRRFGIAPSVVFGLGTSTRYFLSYLHEGESSTPDYGLPYFFDKVLPTNRRNFYGYAADNYLRTSPDIVTGRVEHDFGTHITARNILRWGNYPRDARITEPQIATAPTISLQNGQLYAACVPPACYPLNADPNSVTVRRAQIAIKSVEDILWDQASATAIFHFLGVENDAVLLLEGGRERSNPLRPSYTVPNTSAQNPNPNDPFAPTATSAGVTTHVASQSFGVNFLDTLKLSRWLLLSGGIRYDYFNTTANAPVNGATAASFTNRLDRKPTYRAAVVVKPRPQGSVYFDYGTSFNPSAESLSLSANNVGSPPELNETYEAGAKWDFLRERLNLNGSVFRTEKLNARETDPNNTLNTIQTGNQLVRGVQLGVIGHLPGHMDIIAGYAYLDGRVESSVLNASPFAAAYLQYRNQLALPATPPYFISPVNYPLANVPKNSGNLWITHGLPFRFVGGFGGNYVGARRASSSSMIGLYQSPTPVLIQNVPLAFKSIPDYWTFNAMLRRPVTDNLEFQANVINLTNKFYIDQPHPNHLIPGEGLNAQIGLNLHF